MLNCGEVKLINIFTFQEVLNLFPDYAPVKPHDKNVTATFFSSMMSECDLELPDSLTILGSSFSNLDDWLNLLIWNIYNRHADDYFFEKEGDLDVSDFPKAVNNILNIMDNTIDKYAPMILKLAENASNILKPVKQTQDGSVTFNDTPQEAGVGETDDYTSTFSHNHAETEVEVHTYIEEVSDMMSKYKSILLEWSNEFNCLFLKEEQL